MRPYEIMVILEATLEEAAVQAVITRTEEFLSVSGSELARANKWGKRRLAYEIDHRAEGYYLLMEVRVEPDAVAELDRSLRLIEGVVRHKIVRVPEHAGARPNRPRSPEPALAGPEHNA